jgi:catechol 2,3-dioxygenase-like lactoylglutathione lyase family enzyme
MGAAYAVALDVDGDQRFHDDMTDPATPPTGRVRQLRLVVEAADYDTALRFYRDVLGLTELEAYEGDGDARVAILDAGRATLELANPAQKRMIDAVEVGRDVAPHLRVAFEVNDTAAVTAALVAAGAELIAAPVETPWRSLNSRLAAPAGLQLTLFQELERA